VVDITGLPQARHRGHQKRYYRHQRDHRWNRSRH
jgi:hypothetical protein